MTDRQKTPHTKPHWPQILIELVLTGTASAFMTCLFMLAAALVYRLADTGSAADWVAALANVAMAVTAVLAFVVARSWLPQLTTQEGYKLAISLVNKDVLTLGEDNPLKINVHHAVDAFKALKEREYLIRGETVLKVLHDVYTRADNQVKNIQRQQKQMATYGLMPAPGRAEAFNAMMQALDEISHRTRAQWVLLSVTARGGIDSGPHDDLLEIDNLGMIAELAAGIGWNEVSDNNLNKLNKAWTTMTEQQKLFLGRDNRIGKLFKVRK